jgi:hypothetical protein
MAKATEENVLQGLLLALRTLRASGAQRLLTLHDSYTEFVPQSGGAEEGSDAAFEAWLEGVAKKGAAALRMQLFSAHQVSLQTVCSLAVYVNLASHVNFTLVSVMFHLCAMQCNVVLNSARVELTTLHLVPARTLSCSSCRANPGKTVIVQNDPCHCVFEMHAEYACSSLASIDATRYASNTKCGADGHLPHGSG